MLPLSVLKRKKLDSVVQQSISLFEGTAQGILDSTLKQAASVSQRVSRQNAKCLIEQQYTKPQGWNKHIESPDGGQTVWQTPLPRETDL